MNKKINKLAYGLVVLTATFGCEKSVKVASEDADKRDEIQRSPGNENSLNIWPELSIEVTQDPVIESNVEALLSKMTLEQKVAQMIQPEIRDITVADMRKYGFGSYLNGGGAFPNGNKHSTPQDWITLAENMYQASVDDSQDGVSIPTMWGTDAVHGHNNVIGATLFPHNIGLGAANNPQLIEKIAQATATEVMVTGIDWVFAPTVAVVRDDRWGRTYEGYSEDPDIVKSYASSIVKGLQGAADKDFLGDERVISTVKHFLGDGGTELGDDQGDNIATEQVLFDIHAQGYVGGLTAGAQSVMASFNSWHGVKNHGNKYLLTDVLKTRMGFDGFVVGDWNGHGQVKGCSNESCPQAVNAGLDIFMVPTNAWKPLYENTIAQVNNGEIAMSRIDDAVRRILRVKYRAGLFTKPSPAQRALSGKTELIGQQKHRDIARQAVRESLVLLKNKNNILPLSPHQRILLAGDGADNIGKQSGGWTITWQGTGNNNDDFPGGKSIFDGFAKHLKDSDGSLELSPTGEYSAKPDVAVVVFGEEPYAEGTGDIDNLDYQRGNKTNLALIKRLKAQGIPVVSVFISGRPMWVNAELNASDAFVAAWLPGSEGDGIAEVLLRTAKGTVNYDFVGKLSFSWPNSPEQSTVNRHDQDYTPLLPYGYGLNYSSENELTDELTEDYIKTVVSNKPINILAQSIQSPWRLTLLSNKERLIVSSSEQTLGAVTIKTQDKTVQEDARLFTTNGQALASVTIESNFAEDLRASLESKSALTFSIKLFDNVAEQVFLKMRCEYACENGISLKDIKNDLSLNKWETVSVDLACFKQQGVDLSKVVSPFTLETSDAVAVSFADVSLVPNMAQNATLSCQ